MYGDQSATAFAEIAPAIKCQASLQPGRTPWIILDWQLGVPWWSRRCQPVASPLPCPFPSSPCVSLSPCRPFADMSEILTGNLQQNARHARTARARRLRRVRQRKGRGGGREQGVSQSRAGAHRSHKRTIWQADRRGQMDRQTVGQTYRE